MLNKRELTETVQEELRIIRHLATKLDSEQLDWRPSPTQRSTLELLRYLAMCAIAPAKAAHAGDWTLVRGFVERHANLQLADFERAMQQQGAEFSELLEGISEEDLKHREATLPWGRTVPLGEALFATSVKFLVAYRMQLFLYAKQSGRPELGTHDAWLGIDRPQPASA